jgi:two-component system, cell cycle sensor histidine kinase and response regulator CckA
VSIHPRSEKTVSSLDYKRGSETILLVEDEEVLRHVVVEMLSQLGYKVLEATSGKEALAVAREFPGRIDVLITDVLMPGFSGPQLADSLRASRPGLKVIFISGDAETKDVLGLGDALLQKPFTLKMLSSKLREVLRFEGADC